MEKIRYQGLPNCYHLFNECIELIVTTDFGPHIIRFGFVGQRNEFIDVTPRGFPCQQDVAPQGFAGHRLWHAPDARPRSVIPDKEPVAVEQHDDFIRFTQPTQTVTGIQKEIDLPISPDEAHVAVVHRLYNRGLWPVELAPWALSVMAPGGKAIIPLPPRGSPTENLLPISMMAIWAFSNLSDPRLILGRQYIMLCQDKDSSEPLKIGVMVSDGWTAYYNNGHLFVKTFDYKSGALYPDFGCSVESFTNEAFLELETVAPLTLLQPDESVEYIENWFLFRDIPELHTDGDIEQHVLPLIKS